MGLFTIDRTINFEETKVKKVLSFIYDSRSDEEIEDKMIASNIVSLRDDTPRHGFFRKRWGTFLREFGVYGDNTISEMGELYLNDFLSTKELILLNLINRYAISEKSGKKIRPFESLIRIIEFLQALSLQTTINEEELRYINENLIDNSEESLKRIVFDIKNSRSNNTGLNVISTVPVHYDIWRNLLKTAGISSNNNQIEIDLSLPIVKYISNYYTYLKNSDQFVDNNFMDYIPLPIKCDSEKTILFKRKNYEKSYSKIIYKYLFEKSINKIESEELNAQENGNIPYSILNGFNISTSRQDNPSNMCLYNAFIGYEGIIINKLRKTNDVVYSFIASNIKAFVDEKFYDVEDNMNDLRKFYLENLQNNDYVESMIKQREKFISEYPLSRLLTLTLEEYCLGLDSYKDSFCNKLENGEYRRTGFSMKGAVASKFGIYFKKDGKFHGKNDILIEEPNLYWEKYRQQLYDFLIEMGSREPNFIIDEKYDLLGGAGGYMYLTKLLSLYYPNKYISMSKDDAYRKLNEYLNISNKDNAVLNSYYANIAFRKHVPESNNRFGFYISNAVWKFFKMDEKEDEQVVEKLTFDETQRVNGAYSKIYYGIPGCGKSWIANDFALKCSKDDNLIVRTTFYPDYTNGDFVGQIIPKIGDNNSVLYDIQSGPFTEAMVKAIDNPNQYVCLIVEEINRGNAAAIFGDLFQLLDRKEDGTSTYWIKNYIITEYLKKHCLNKSYDVEHIRIPSNLYIIGTMNTSDQNVFTLDTAFKRRWKMEYIQNNIDDCIYANELVPLSNVTWSEFVKEINDFITGEFGLDINGEDKQIGSYFISSAEWNDIKTTSDPKEAARIFAEKILSYIWDDVAKINRDSWFDKNKYKTLDSLVKGFTEKGLEIFSDNISFTREENSNGNE